MCDFDRFDKTFGIDKSKKTPGSSKKQNIRKAGSSLSKKRIKQELYEDTSEFKLNLTVKRRRSEAGNSTNSLLRTPEINNERLLKTPKVNRSWQSRLSGYTSTQTSLDSTDKESIIPYISCDEGDFKDDLQVIELAATSDEE